MSKFATIINNNVVWQIVSDMNYYYPFGEIVHPLVQQDRTPKKVFVLGVYASAVHARWKIGSKTICPAMAVASEPRIFWDGNPEEAAEIISRIHLPEGLGTLEPAGSHLNGPSAKVLDEHILAPLGFTRKDAWLCDLLPERIDDIHFNSIIFVKSFDFHARFLVFWVYKIEGYIK